MSLLQNISLFYRALLQKRPIIVIANIRIAYADAIRKYSLSLSLCLSLSPSHSLSHTHKHTHTVSLSFSLSLPLTHSHSLTLTHSLTLSHTLSLFFPQMYPPMSAGLQYVDPENMTREEFYFTRDYSIEYVPYLHVCVCVCVCV